MPSAWQARANSRERNAAPLSVSSRLMLTPKLA
jgi:hypothetical protein